MYKILNRGRFLPTPTLREGDLVFDRDGYVRTVLWVGLATWGSTDGFVHVNGAFQAIDVSDHPVARVNVVTALKEKGAL